ncbi:Bgt-548 [Blumeria graminis f. sp. tritici]|uniref:AN1-type zinc finger protein n=3 Tax=Blumeria graminis f. sp. tritici TaxID=62690 RepID=A0A656KT47_BLUGR|nr:hypothetical protein BGT96224_548 [Blumeria graminis f. sp. tritici 96224]VCU41231.1 Bgt-548 [Blumeria graminis f. sp. tritici]
MAFSNSEASEHLSNIQIFIKNMTGDTIPLSVPTGLSIQNLTEILSVKTSRPETDLRLSYAGKHLSPLHSLSTYNIRRESLLHLTSPIRGGMPPKKIRCSFKDCRDGVQRIVGDCGFCSGHFCGKHRLLEDHKCEGLEDVSTAAPLALGLNPICHLENTYCNTLVDMSEPV